MLRFLTALTNTLEHSGERKRIHYVYLEQGKVKARRSSAGIRGFLVCSQKYEAKI